MKRNYIISLILSFLLWWTICYLFNTTALIEYWEININ